MAKMAFQIRNYNIDVTVKKDRKLYLAKGEKEDRKSTVFVDIPRLPQHQYDGIRFLYRQYKKGKAGVILNDPPGYGKRVQTVLFVSALRELLNNPILILCPEGYEKIWLRHFHIWTGMFTDTHVMRDNEYTNSLCVICAIHKSFELTRNQWDILVVDDDCVSREVLRAGFKAEFKIWLTAHDMKKHLQTFTYIYRCFYPNDMFVVDDYPADNKPSAVLAHSVRLDAFMEDIVIRRSGVAVPLAKNYEPPVPPRVTRKNKDATGTKIKRSKRLPIAYYYNVITEPQESPSEHSTSEESNKSEALDASASIEDFVVYIEDQSKSELEENDPKDDITENSNRNSEILNLESGDDKIREVTNEMDIDLNTANDVPISNLTPDSDKQDDSVAILNSDTGSQNIVIKYDSESQDDEIEKSKVTNEIVVSEDLFSTDIVSEDVQKLTIRKPN